MTLFKRVFNNHAQGAAEGPIVPSRPLPAEADLALDEELAADFAEDPTEDDPQGVSGEDTNGDPDDAPEAPLANRQAPAQEMHEAVKPERPLRRAPEEPSTRDEDLSMAERAAQAQIDIRKSHLRRVEPEEQAEAPPPRAQLRHQPEPAPQAEARRSDADAEAEAAEAAIAAPRPGRSARRVRTRMLGFNAGADIATDPFAKAAAESAAPALTHPVGWMVVVSGPGTGHAFALYNGVSTIGRGSDQTVALDFGDTSISREKHAAVAYDDETNAFFLGHGGKSNIVRLNNRPVLSTEDIGHGDSVRIGETTLRFVALCGADFSWGGAANAGA